MQFHSPFIAACLMGTALLLTGSCASVCTTGVCNTLAAEEFSTRAGFAVERLEGSGFSHEVHWRSTPTARTLWIFIEGDGEAWIEQRMIADDPTPRHPLALHLAARTDGAVAYLGRPCFFSSIRDLRCTPSMWTVDRYSAAVVASMNAIATQLAGRLKADRIVLVGHSGGGALAALMARELSNVAGLVTVAGNLDVEAWTTLHRYWPLSGSLNPADEPPLPASITQIHLIGEQDVNVPPAINARFLSRVPDGNVWRYRRFGHTCCWEEEWPDVLKRLATHHEAFVR